jgi:hypothetical protein
MGAFSLYPLFEADVDEETATAILDPYVEAYSDVTYETESLPDPPEDAFVPEETLSIETLDTFVELFEDLLRYPEIEGARLWGPGSERFPVIIQHSALQQLSDPDLYEFHALDDRRTMVVAESELEFRRIHEEIPPTSRE